MVHCGDLISFPASVSLKRWIRVRLSDGAVDLGNVYIAMDPIGTIIGVYKCPERAIERSVQEVSGHFLDQVHVEASDCAIFVDGEKGKVTILIESILA